MGAESLPFNNPRSFPWPRSSVVIHLPNRIAVEERSRCPSDIGRLPWRPQLVHSLRAVSQLAAPLLRHILSRQSRSDYNYRVNYSRRMWQSRNTKAPFMASESL